MKKLTTEACNYDNEQQYARDGGGQESNVSGVVFIE